MRTSIARLIAVFGLLIGALALGTAASAAPGNGATVFNPKPYCFTNYYTVCEQVHEVFNQTTTPSGNINYINNGHFNFTVTDPNGTVVYSDTAKTHVHYLLTDSGTKEFQVVDCYTETFFGYTESFGIRYHYANGQVQYLDIGPGC